MNRRFLNLTLALLLALGIAASAPQTAHANMGDREIVGEPVGEPSPLLDSIHVVHEELSIDMRPIPKRQPCRVEATYRLRNDGSTRKLDLVFIAGGLHDSAGAFTIMLDGVRIDGHLADSLATPIEWRLPSHTPGIGRLDSLSYMVWTKTSGPQTGQIIHSSGSENRIWASSTSTILFSLELAEGEHTVTFSYDADATGNPDAGDVYVWQLGYILAPARRWASFGRLDARILLPKDWEAAVTPEMKRSGDTLIGSWNTLPADAIAISTRLHVSEVEYWMARGIPIVLTIALIFLFSFRAGWKKGKSLGREGQSLTRAIPVAILCAFLSFLLLGGGMMAMDSWIGSLQGGEGVPGYGSWVFILMFAFTPLPLLLIIPSAIVFIAAAMARSRVRRTGTTEEPAEPVNEI